jgi:WD40 repeat protein
LNLAVAPDGRTAVSEAQDGSVIAWDLTGAQRLGRTFRWRTPQQGCPTTPCFWIAPRSSFMAEAVADGSVALVDLRAHRLVATLPARNGRHADALAFFPDGRTLASGGSNGHLTVWDVKARSVARTLRFRDRVWWVAVSPDAKLLAVQTQGQGSSNSRVEVRDVASGAVRYRHLVRFGHRGLEFSPNGRQLAAVGCCERGSTIEVWDARSGAKLYTPKLKGHATAIAFSPDGLLLAAGTEDGSVVLLNARTGTQLESLQVGTGAIDPVSFSPDGRLFVATSSDQTSTLWDVESRKRLGTSFAVETGSIPVVRFAPNGDLVIDNLADTAVWPTGLRAWERFACDVAGRDLTRGEWSQLLPNRPYRSICAQ